MSTSFNSRATELFSEYKTLTSGDTTLSTGWIDMKLYPAYLFKGLAAANVTLTTESAFDSAGTQNVVTTGPSAQDAITLIFGAPSRNRYMRFTYTLTDAVSTNVHIAIQGTDMVTASLFRIGNSPSPFTPALTTQAIGFGQQPDGDFVNTPADGEALSTTSTLSGGATYTSDWFDTDGWNAIELFISSDVESETQGIEVEYTDDVQAGTWRRCYFGRIRY